MPTLLYAVTIVAPWQCGTLPDGSILTKEETRIDLAYRGWYSVRRRRDWRLSPP